MNSLTARKAVSSQRSCNEWDNSGYSTSLLGQQDCPGKRKLASYQIPTWNVYNVRTRDKACVGSHNGNTGKHDSKYAVLLLMSAGPGEMVHA